MTPDQFRRQREALGLSHAALASLLGVTSADVIRCEEHASPSVTPFVRALAIACAELHLDAAAPRARVRRSRRAASDHDAHARPAAAQA